MLYYQHESIIQTTTHHDSCACLSCLLGTVHIVISCDRHTCLTQMYVLQCDGHTGLTQIDVLQCDGQLGLTRMHVL